MRCLQVKQVSRQTLTVIGSGISGLMTAWYAAQAGLKVVLYSRGPDPRVIKDNNIEHGSSTFDSKSDQRYITLFEGHPYLELTGYVDKAYPGIADDFRKGVLQGGFLATTHKEFDELSSQWINERNAANEHLSANNPKKIKEVEDLFTSYARENRAAIGLWYNILTDSIKSHPELLQNLTLCHKGVLQIYDDEDMYEAAKQSRQENGVLKQDFTLQKLMTVFPAYSEGIKRGLIKGGAVETYGLAFGIQAFGKHLINEMDNMGVSIHFDSEVTELIKNGDVVEGIMVKGCDVMRQSDHYIFHTGAFAGPELFKNIPQAKNKLAAVEGYWITIENADRLLKAMGDKPIKVHGKKSLTEILNRIDIASARNYSLRFQKLGISEEQLSAIAPIVDFNNMPIRIRKNNIANLGVSSGYIFKGVSQRDKSGQITFLNNEISEQFVLTVMELWLEALYGKKLLTEGTKIIVHPKGCKRSWTPDDQELDVNLSTSSGGLCMIYDGGNTGSTTKSPFIAKYSLCKIIQAKNAEQDFSGLRHSLGRTVEEIGPDQWEQLTKNLDMTVKEAHAKRSL